MRHEFGGLMYVTLNDFVEMTRRKPETILKRKNEIPVIKKFDGAWYALEGTRYPCNVRRFKIKNDYDKRYVLLKAIYDRKYIDSKLLCVYQKEFEDMLDDFLAAGLIRENNLGNTYGANAYSCSQKGAEYFHGSKREKIIALIEEAVKSAGIFTGAIISQII